MTPADRALLHDALEKTVNLLREKGVRVVGTAGGIVIARDDGSSYTEAFSAITTGFEAAGPEGDPKDTTAAVLYDVGMALLERSEALGKAIN